MYKRQTVRKSDLTGSVMSLKAQDLTRGSNINLQQTLAGRAPGVQVYQKSGEPGSAMSVQIRGITSITGNNDPLYVVAVSYTHLDVYKRQARRCVLCIQGR